MIFKDVDLKELVQMMRDHDLAEITLKDGKTVVEIKRNKEPIIVNGETISNRWLERIPGPKVLTKEAHIPGEINEKSETEAAKKDKQNDETYHIVEAPLVGTFYRASAPEEEPFVEVGDKVDSGDVLCIVEAMKSMNEIQADVSGVIKEICVNNTDLVEFEQPLFKIEPES